MIYCCDFTKKELFFISFILFTLLSFEADAQIVEVKGKVLDKISGKPLQGVSIIVSKYIGTISNNRGEFYFTIKESLLKKNQITFSYISYQKKSIIYDTKRGYIIITMDLSDNFIPGISVYGNTKSILQKAIERITLNYPLEPTTQTGIMRVYNTVGDTDYYYKSDAVVQIYFPSYMREKPQLIKVLQNRQLLLKNPASKYSQEEEKTRWVGGFHSIPDFVYQKSDFINLEKLNTYEYFQREKTFFNGRRVFLIDFESLNKKIEGSLYIDTSTYAFVAANITEYNIKNLFFVPISVRKYSVEYNLINGKWYIGRTHSESRHVQKIENNNYIVDYSRVTLDTLNVSKFSYGDVIQKKDENIKINKEMPRDNWLRYDSIIKKEEVSGVLSNVPIPNIDTTTKKINPKSNVYKTILNYLRNNNFKANIFISRIPTKIPNSNENLMRYGVGLGSQFRIIKDLFIEYNEIYNFGIGRVNNSMIELYVSNNFELNKSKRPLTISPIGGYNKITSYSDKHQKTIFNNYTLGTRIDLEWTHKKSLFVRGMYSNKFNKKNSMAKTQVENIIVSGGLIFKF